MRRDPVLGYLWLSLAGAVLLIALGAGLTVCLTWDDRPKADVAVAAPEEATPVATSYPPGRPKVEAAEPVAVVAPAPPPMKRKETAEEPPEVVADPAAIANNPMPPAPSAPTSPPSSTAPLPDSDSSKTEPLPLEIPAVDLPKGAPPTTAKVPVPTPRTKVATLVVAPEKQRAPTDTVSFMNSTAKGKRFCIIADCSGSMSGAPMLYLKQEMIKTLASLKDDSQFYVIFFSSQAIPMPSPTWVNGGKANVAKVLPWIQAMPAMGGTEPFPAFVKAFQLDPKPDVIFFMTDGLIPRTVPDQVALLNRTQPPVVINSIMFAHPNVMGHRVTPAVLQSVLTVASSLVQRTSQPSGGTYNLVKLGLP
jgi:hypothetical protein